MNSCGNGRGEPGWRASRRRSLPRVVTNQSARAAGRSWRPRRYVETLAGSGTDRTGSPSGRSPGVGGPRGGAAPAASRSASRGGRLRGPGQVPARWGVPGVPQWAPSGAERRGGDGSGQGSPAPGQRRPGRGGAVPVGAAEEVGAPVPDPGPAAGAAVPGGAVHRGLRADLPGPGRGNGGAVAEQHRAAEGRVG